MSITLVTDGSNLLDSGADALVNAVNCVGIMGGGLALMFAKKWPEMEQQYIGDCTEGLLHPGRMHLWEIPPGGRFVVNFPTKRDLSPSRYEDIADGLSALYDELTVGRLGETSTIAVPPLGCGLGGLRWDIVKTLIGVLDGVDQEVLLYEPWEGKR